MPYRTIALAVALGGLLTISVAAQSGRARTATPAAAPPPPAVEAPADAASPAKKEAVRSAPVAVDAHYDTKYAGGTLTFEKDAKTKITIKDGVIRLTSKDSTVEIPAAKVTEMTYGENVRQRLAEGVGVGVLVPGLGGLIGKTKSRAHYIEILWDLPPNGGAALRVDKDDYRGLIAALEGSTGVKVEIQGQPGPIDWP